METWGQESTPVLCSRGLPHVFLLPVFGVCLLAPCHTMCVTSSPHLHACKQDGRMWRGPCFLGRHCLRVHFWCCRQQSKEMPGRQARVVYDCPRRRLILLNHTEEANEVLSVQSTLSRVQCVKAVLSAFHLLILT